MVNKLIELLRNDVQIIRRFMLILVVFLLLVFLRTIDKAQEKSLKQLQGQKSLILQIPELQNQLVSTAQGLSLNGIIFNKDMPVAIINNAIAKEGDLVASNIKVVSIKSDSVVLNDGSKNFELKLQE